MKIEIFQRPVQTRIGLRSANHIALIPTHDLDRHFGNVLSKQIRMDHTFKMNKWIEIAVEPQKSSTHPSSHIVYFGKPEKMVTALHIDTDNDQNMVKDIIVGLKQGSRRGLVLLTYRINHNTFQNGTVCLGFCTTCNLRGIKTPLVFAHEASDGTCHGCKDDKKTSCRSLNQRLDNEAGPNWSFRRLRKIFPINRGSV